MSIGGHYGYYLIENDLCLATIIRKPFLIFWKRWHYSVCFYKDMRINPYKKIVGRRKTEIEATKKAFELYEQEKIIINNPS